MGIIEGKDELDFEQQNIRSYKKFYTFLFVVSANLLLKAKKIVLF